MLLIVLVRLPEFHTPTSFPESASNMWTSNLWMSTICTDIGAKTSRLTKVFEKSKTVQRAMKLRMLGIMLRDWKTAVLIKEKKGQYFSCHREQKKWSWAGHALHRVGNWLSELQDGCRGKGSTLEDGTELKGVMHQNICLHKMVSAERGLHPEVDIKIGEW